MGLVGTMGFAAIMASEAPVCSSGLDHTGDRIGDPPGLPMPTRRWSSRPLRQSMSPRLHRARPRPPRSIGTIVMIHRGTIRLSSSALGAGDPSRRPHHERQPSARLSPAQRHQGARASATATLELVAYRVRVSRPPLGGFPPVTTSSDNRGRAMRHARVWCIHLPPCRRSATWCP